MRANDKLMIDNLLLRSALSNLLHDMERALTRGPYNAAHLTQTKYFVEAREALNG